jgi:hypothetical protein
MIYKAKQKAARRLKQKRGTIIYPQNGFRNPERCAKRDSVQSMSFRHSSLAAVSELLLTYVRKDIQLIDHNPLFYVFLYTLCMTTQAPKFTCLLTDLAPRSLLGAMLLCHRYCRYQQQRRGEKWASSRRSRRGAPNLLAHAGSELSLGTRSSSAGLSAR